MPNCLDCTTETQAVYHHRQSIAMNTCTCCCRVGKCTLLTIIQISDRLSVIGFFWWHQYRISVHAKNPHRYTSNINDIIGGISSNTRLFADDCILYRVIIKTNLIKTLFMLTLTYLLNGLRLGKWPLMQRSVLCYDVLDY